MKTIAFILTMMAISSALFIAQCITFLQDHSFWEMVTSPIQFWTGNFGIASALVALTANLAVMAAVKRD